MVYKFEIGDLLNPTKHDRLGLKIVVGFYEWRRDPTICYYKLLDLLTSSVVHYQASVLERYYEKVA